MMKNLIQCLVLTIFPATYYIQQTTTISNCKTLTAPPVTRVTTKTPCDQVLTQNETITKLVEKLTTIDFTSTTTVTPTCRGGGGGGGGGLGSCVQPPSFNR